MQREDPLIIILFKIIYNCPLVILQKIRSTDHQELGFLSEI